MTKLICNVKNCYYNKDARCCRDGIQVQGHDATIEDATFCSSFKEKLDHATSKVQHTSSAPERSLDVNCNVVKCIFNDNEKCHASKIGIEGHGAKHESQTICGSFQYK